MNIIKKVLTATSILSLIIWTQTISANPLVELEATPSVISEPDAIFIITEISFKNTVNDWVKISYSSPTEKPINLKNVSFGYDSVFKTIEEDFIIASGQEILFNFKSDEEDSMPYLYTERSGLTGTTEQFIIYDQNLDVLDAVCWTSTSPTTKEISDLEQLHEKEGWSSADINSCISSEDIPANESIFRVGPVDTNSSNDWTSQSEITAEITQENTNELTGPELVELINYSTAEGQEPKIAETKEIIAPGLIEIDQTKIPTIEEKETPKKKSTTKSSSKKKSETNYKNGNLSNEIIINEILANPEGSDSKKEWIELFNKGETDINLGNWQIDDDEDGSKPYRLPDSITIKSNNVILIESKTSKLNLGNKEDEIRLFDYNNVLVDAVSYEEAPSGESYSLISITKESATIQTTPQTEAQEDPETTFQWMWTAEITPNHINPSYLEITAEIVEEPLFEDFYSFVVQDKNEQMFTISFDEETIAAPLAKASFIKGVTAKLLIQKNKEESYYILKKFEILNSIPKKDNLSSYLIPSIVGTILLIAIISFFILRKKIPWKPE